MTPINIDTSRTVSTQVLRCLAASGPQTVEQLMKALDMPADYKPKIGAVVRNLRTRGRLIGTRIPGVSGRPTVYSLRPETRAALEAPRAGDRPWRHGSNGAGERPPKAPRGPRPLRAPKPLSSDQVRWCGYFLRAGWGRSAVARLFKISARDIAAALHDA